MAAFVSDQITDINLIIRSQNVRYFYGATFGVIFSDKKCFDEIVR